LVKNSIRGLIFSGWVNPTFGLEVASEAAHLIRGRRTDTDGDKAQTGTERKRDAAHEPLAATPDTRMPPPPVGVGGGSAAREGKGPPPLATLELQAARADAPTRHRPTQIRSLSDIITSFHTRFFTHCLVFRADF